MTDLDAQLINEFRGFIANAMLTRIVCFSAEPYFQRVAQDLATFLGIAPQEASELLLVTSQAISNAAQIEAQKHLRIQVVSDAA